MVKRMQYIRLIKEFLDLGRISKKKEKSIKLTIHHLHLILANRPEMCNTSQTHWDLVNTHLKF